MRWMHGLGWIACFVGCAGAPSPPPPAVPAAEVDAAPPPAPADRARLIATLGFVPDAILVLGADLVLTGEGTWRLPKTGGTPQLVMPNEGAEAVWLAPAEDALYVL